jgi:hypothetical protein
MGESFEDALPENYGLPHKEKRRYAKANQVFELGLWGHPLDLIKGVELTTRMGSRNTWFNMKQDNRDLRKRLRKQLKIVAEDCFCAEISPKNHLLHLHGFYRLVEPMSAVKLHSILSPFWSEIHDAPVVWVQDIYSAGGLLKYNVKHALKNYATLEFGDMRMLKSKGWLPKGWKEVTKILVKWALEHGAKWGFDSEGLEDFQGDYVAYAWDVMKEYIYRWCNDELVVLDFQDSVVEIWGEDIRESPCGEFGNGVNRQSPGEFVNVI